MGLDCGSQQPLNPAARPVIGCTPVSPSMAAQHLHSSSAPTLSHNPRHHPTSPTPTPTPETHSLNTTSPGRPQDATVAFAFAFAFSRRLDVSLLKSTLLAASSIGLLDKPPSLISRTIFVSDLRGRENNKITPHLHGFFSTRSRYLPRPIREPTQTLASTRLIPTNVTLLATSSRRPSSAPDPLPTFQLRTKIRCRSIDMLE